MSPTPVEELQSQTGVEKTEEETVREYVERVGAESDVDTETIEGALTYITEWHYSETPPDDDAAFRTLLGQARELETAPEQTADPPDGPDGDERDTTEGRRPEATSRRRARGATRSGFKSGIEGREPRMLVLRFLAIAGTAPVIGWTMARAWVPGNLLYDRVRSILIQVLGISGVAAMDLVAVFGLGLYAALLVLFVADVKKRVQGVLLILGTGLAFAAVGSVGVFFPSLELTPLNVVSLILGFVAGLAIESGQLLALDFRRSTFQRPTLDTGQVTEFRGAALFLFALVAVVTLATLAQVLVAGTVRVFDLPAVGVFLVLLYQFVQYESETNYTTLGPERSGKSMLMLGLCLELLRHSETHPNPNAYLQRGLERASNLQPGAEQWPIPSTAHDEVRAASFEVISGYYFPRRLELTALDYAGQHLGRIADVFASEASPNPDESVPQQVATWVADADTLFFILDVERLVFPGEFHEAGSTDREHVSWGLDHYTTIVDHVDPDDVIVIATKCDILIDQGIVSPPSDHDSFAVFGDAVTDHLLSRPDVQELLSLTGASSVHPVYYATKKRDGAYVPQLDDDGNLVPVGYGHLVDEIRNRQ